MILLILKYIYRKFSNRSPEAPILQPSKNSKFLNPHNSLSNRRKNFKSKAKYVSNNGLKKIIKYPEMI